MRAKPLGSMTAVVAVTIGLSYLCLLLHATPTVAAMVFFLGVLLAGMYLTLGDALVASFTAALCLDYFFVPPIWEITVGDLQGWFSLLIFLCVSLLTTNLSRRVRRQRDELIAQQEEKEKLYALSRAMLLMTGENVRRLIVNKCVELFGFTEAAIYETASGIIQRSHVPGRFSDEMLLRAATMGAVDCRDNRSTCLLPIALGNKIFGSFAFSGQSLPETTMQTLANTVAVALAQAQAQESSSRANAVRQGEELKSVMIDALAHDLKTPLTVMEAAGEMLESAELDAEQKLDLVQVLREETRGLRRLVDEALHLARIDAKQLKLRTESVALDEIVREALAAMGPRATAREIRVTVPEGLPPVFADRELMVQACKQLLDNAVKYSPARTPILVAASAADGLVSLAVQDEGGGLTELEQTKVFDKFYRGARASSGVQGTGMGLAIAREIAEAHGGGLSVESQVGRGSRFTLTLHSAANSQPQPR